MYATEDGRDPESQRRSGELQQMRIQRNHFSPPRHQSRQCDPDTHLRPVGKNWNFRSANSPYRGKAASRPPMGCRSPSPGIGAHPNQPAVGRAPSAPASAKANAIQTDISAPPALDDIIFELLEINNAFKWIAASQDLIATPASQAKLEVWTEIRGEKKAHIAEDYKLPNFKKGGFKRAKACSKGVITKMQGPHGELQGRIICWLDYFRGKLLGAGM